MRYNQYNNAEPNNVTYHRHAFDDAETPANVMNRQNIYNQNEVHNDIDSRINEQSESPMRTARREIDNRNNEEPNEKIKWPFGLHQDLNMIMDYNGHANMLPTFSQSIRNVRDFLRAETEPWILNALSSKLKGSAADAFVAKLTQYESIKHFLRDLETQYCRHEKTDGLKRKL